MKKLTALLLALVMLLSMTGCDLLKPELLGSYEIEIDLRDAVIKQFDSGTTFSGTAYSLEHYLESFPVTVNFEFTEEGTYHIAVSRQSIENALVGLKAAAAAMIDDYVFAGVKARYESYGFSVDTRDDVAAFVNMSWDELCTEVLEVSPEKYVDVIITNAFVDALTAEYRSEGQFKARKGQLHLSEHMDLKPSNEIYETYVIEGSTVTFTDGVNLEDNVKIPYPYTIKKIG